jgi:hypothetical protein
VNKYTVIDPSGCYSNQVVTVPFEIDITKQSQTTVLANLATLKAIAIPRMYGCPLEDVDAGHVRDMFESVYVEDVEPTPTRMYLGVPSATQE